MSDRIFVESLDPTAAYPVAGVYRNFTDVGTAFVQQMIVTDAGSIGNVQLRVLSLANANPMATALVDRTGTQIDAFSVTAVQGTTPWTMVGSTAVTQATSPWITRAGSVGFTVPQGAVVGSVGATQLGAPWTFTGSVSVTGSVGATVQGSVSGTVVASIVGLPLLTQPYAVATLAFSTVLSVTITTSERFVVAAAPGANLRNYVTTLLVTVPSMASVVDVLDGTTPIWRGYAATAGGGFAVAFPMPLRQPTANTSLGIQFQSSGTGGTGAIAGFTGA